MRTPPWETFFEESIRAIFAKKGMIVDIGGGLRTEDRPNNRSGFQLPWLEALAKEADYKILDKIPDYHPDIVGDIHNLPFADASVDAIICMAVLEHVEEPQKAVKEMYRILKPGGICFIHVPFLYYYHPLPGYYQDFYRFTYDGVRYITRDFAKVEVRNVRGAFESVMNLLPFFSKRAGIFRVLDRLFRKTESRQTSGYNLFCVK